MKYVNHIVAFVDKKLIGQQNDAVVDTGRGFNTPAPQATLPMPCGLDMTGHVPHRHNTS